MLNVEGITTSESFLKKAKEKQKKGIESQKTLGEVCLIYWIYIWEEWNNPRGKPNLLGKMN